MPPPDRLRVAALAATVAIGAALRLTGLGAESFWHDESWTWALIRGGPADVVHRLIHFDAHPPFYFLLLQGWSVIGDSEADLRLMSAALSIASIPLLYAFVARLGGPGAGLVAAILLAASPYHVWYAKEARSYALLFLLCLGSIDQLFRLRDAPSRARWAGWAALSAAIMYTHYMGAFFILAEVAVVVLFRRDRPGLLKEASLASLAAFALFLPWLPFFWAHATSVTKGFWLPAPTPASVMFSMAELVGNPDALPRSLGYWTAAPFYAAALGLPLLTRRREHVALALLLAVPVAGELLAGVRTPLFYTQTFQYVLIPVFAATACAVARLPGRATAPAALALVAVMLPALRMLEGTPRKENWRDLVRFVDEHHRQGEELIVDPGYVAVNLAPYRHSGSPWQGDVVRVGAGDLIGPWVERKEAMGAVLRDAPGVWLVYRYGQDLGWTRELEAAFERKESFSSRGAEAHRFVRR